MSDRTKILLAAAVIISAAACRLADHPFNFTPIAAMALFAGCYLKNKWAIMFPLVAMLVSDYFLGFYHWPVMLTVYVSFILIFFLGRLLARRFKWQNVVFSSLAGSIIFFLLTNFAVWAFANWYPHTWQGLINCFTLALPFFRNTLTGDLFYVGLFFGAYELVSKLAAKEILAEKIFQ